LPALLCPPAWAGWTVYEGCRLIDHPYNDGDSFHVKTQRRHYVFRLYFVDAPETDDDFPDRRREQADYWDVDLPTAHRIGEQATAFTADFLEPGFTVFSRKEDARGRGRAPRYFAMIRVNDQYLSEALVRAGLARVYGMSTDLPDGTEARRYWTRLRLAERRARREQAGAWARHPPASSRLPASDEVGEHDRPLRKTTPIYSVTDPPRLLGILRKGTTVTVMQAESRSLVRVRFHDGDRLREGRCRRSALGPSPVP
jgi:endonuclease YncB( thermonuclease family)